MEQIPKRLLQLIAPNAMLKTQDWQAGWSKVKTQTILKGEYWVREGDVSQYIGFINKGVFRVFSTVDGKEKVAHFCYEERNTIVSAYTSFVSQRPSLESIQALEDTELIILHYDALQELYESNPIYEKLGRLLIEQMYVAAKVRIYKLQHQTATERYQALLVKYPNLINRIAHHHVAAYLGIAPESLSRLRKSLAKKR